MQQPLSKIEIPDDDDADDVAVAEEMKTSEMKDLREIKKSDSFLIRQGSESVSKGNLSK